MSTRSSRGDLTLVKFSTAQVRDVSTLAQKEKIAQPFDIDFAQIDRDGYQLMRGFGLSIARLESELCRVSGGKLFFSAHIGSFVHKFRVLPGSGNLSEQPACGGYHTDFMFQSRPPAFVALLCLRPDPKHPVYGRNQVVHRDSFLERMNSIYGVTQADLLGQKIEYSFPGRAPISLPILQILDDQLILTLHTSLMPTGSLVSFGNRSLKMMIDTVCSEMAHEVVLDRGDLLIVSNHVALHRRSECTLAFNAADGSFTSREMATVRFDR